MPRPPAAALLLCAAVLSLCCAAGEPPPEGAEAAPPGPVTVIVVGDEPYPCKVIKHDEKTVTVYLLDAKTTTQIEWSKLKPMERERVKKLIAAAARKNQWGRRLDGVEVKLKSGLACVGLELVERATPTHRYFRFPGVPLMGIARKDIKSVAPVKVYESEVYKPEGLYRKKLAESPPRTAEDHFRLAEWCLERGLLEEAGDHLARCRLLDGAFGKRCDEKSAELEKKLAERAKRNPLRRPPPRRKLKPAEAHRKVVSSWHLWLEHFVQKRAREKVSTTPPVQVSVVHLKGGTAVEGQIKGGTDGRTVTVESGGRTYSVKRELVDRIEEKWVERGPFRNRTLAECRAYVTDGRGGVTADVLVKVAGETGLAGGRVMDIWKGRFADADPRKPGSGPPCREAHWSVGSWLRGYDPAKAPAAAGKHKWPDPEAWWKRQSPAVRAQVLKAMCAEALMRVEKVYSEACINCGGARHIEVMTAKGGTFKYPCSVCRAAGRFCVVSYR